MQYNQEWQNIKFGTIESGKLNLEYQIWNGKTQNTKSGTPIYRTVLSDGKSKTWNSKTRNTKPEKVPPDHIDCFTKKNIYVTARHVEMRRDYKTRGNGKSI